MMIVNKLFYYKKQKQTKKTFSLDLVYTLHCAGKSYRFNVQIIKLSGNKCL